MVRGSFQLVGDSGAGKTALIGEFGKWHFKETGGKIDPATKKVIPGKGKITRIYTADSGGWVTIQPLVDVGIVEVVPLQTMPFPFQWLREIVQGKVPGKDPKTGKIFWKHATEGVGVFAFEGITAFSDCLMAAMAEYAAQNVNIGGDGAFNFKDGDVTVGSNNRGHYLQAQTAVPKAISTSQWVLPEDSFVIWTAIARRGEDENAGQVLGPQAAGKALTHDLPRWIQYTFRVTAEPGEDPTKPPVHKLFLADHKDKMLRGAKGLGNNRVPLDPEAIKLLPNVIEPASLVKAYELIRGVSNKVVNNLVEEFK